MTHLSTNIKQQVGLYIHIPYCLKKCSYCDFFSLPLSSLDWLENYTAGILTELKLRAAQVPDLLIETVFFGGGTPSLLSSQQVEQILETINTHYNVLRNAEISLETNPATLKASRLQGFLNAGINRLSLGVQSFSDDDLKVLGRIHDGQDIMNTIELIHRENLANFSIDLIYGVPGQSQERWEKNLEMAVSCKPSHISAYLLQLDSSTSLARDIEQGKMELLDEDSEWLMYKLCMDFLQDKGYEHYEISNFCRPGFACRHNLNYWRAGHYIGIGTGAVSYLNNKRYINRPPIEEYLSSLQAGGDCTIEVLEEMSLSEMLTDAVILGLRMCEGINLEDFKARFGIDLSVKYYHEIEKCIACGWLKYENGQINLTKRGYFLSNQVFCQFIN